MDRLIIEFLIEHRRKSVTKSAYFPKFIMLCGKENNCENIDNRHITNRILEEKRSDVFSIYSEDLFSIVKKHRKIQEMDLLKFEELLVEISDGVILFLESFGTATELGAFAYIDMLASKTLVFADQQFKDDKSFINGGPLKRIISLTERQSNVGGVEFSEIFSNGNIDFGGKNYDRIINFIVEKRISLDSNNLDLSKKNKFKITPSLLILFIIDVIYILEKLSYEDIFQSISEVLLRNEPDFSIIINSNNKFNDEFVKRCLLDMLIKWKLLRKGVSSKKGCEIYSINYSQITKDSQVYQTFGKVLFTASLFSDKNYAKQKLRIIKLNEQKYGDILWNRK